LDITPLPELDKEIAAFVDRMKFYGQDLNTIMIKPFWQMMHNFMERGTGRSPTELTGEIMEESMVEGWKVTNPNVYTWSFFHRMLPAYLFGDYDYAEYLSAGCRSLVDFPYGAVVSGWGLDDTRRLAFKNFSSWPRIRLFLLQHRTLWWFCFLMH
jgi:hypothetical protein